MAGPVVYRVNEAMVQTYRDYELRELVQHRIDLIQRLAIRNAPRRTGRLKANIRHARPKPRGQYEMEGYVYANIGYAMYVERGTYGPIFPRTAKMLVFQANGTAGLNKGPIVRRSFVRGQAGRHYMRLAFEEAMAASYI